MSSNGQCAPTAQGGKSLEEQCAQQLFLYGVAATDPARVMGHLEEVTLYAQITANFEAAKARMLEPKYVNTELAQPGEFVLAKMYMVRDAAEQQYWFNENSLMAQMKNPNIPRVVAMFRTPSPCSSDPDLRDPDHKHEVSPTYPSLCFTLYQIHGPSLWDVNRRLQLDHITESELATLFGQIGGALAYIHGAGVIHNSLSLANIVTTVPAKLDQLSREQLRELIGKHPVMLTNFKNFARGTFDEFKLAMRQSDKVLRLPQQRYPEVEGKPDPRLNPYLTEGFQFGYILMQMAAPYDNRAVTEDINPIFLQMRIDPMLKYCVNLIAKNHIKSRVMIQSALAFYYANTMGAPNQDTASTQTRPTTPQKT